jgi:hypothetical protein
MKILTKRTHLSTKALEIMVLMSTHRSEKKVIQVNQRIKLILVY